MIEVKDNVVIKRPADEVFAYVADQTSAPRWQDGLVEVRRTTEGPIGIGTRHTAVRTFMGRRLELTNVYIHFEPGRYVAFTGASGPLTFEAAYGVEPVADGARLTSTVAIRAGGLFRVAERLVAADLRRDVAANLAALRVLLEGEATPAGGAAAGVEASPNGAMP